MQVASLAAEIRAHVEQRDFPAAQALCLAWRDSAPGDPDALHVSGEIALLLGDVAGGIAFFLEADALRPDWTTKLYLAYAHLLRKDYAAAEAACRSAISRPGLAKHEVANTHEMLKDIAMVRQLSVQPLVEGQNGLRDSWEQDAVAAMATLPAHAGFNVVFFHVGGQAHPFLKVAVDYTAVLLRAMQAARTQHPEAAVFLLTDKATDTSAFSAVATVVRLDLDADMLMYSRMRSYRALAATGKLTSPVLFLDTDVHLNRPFTPAFSGEFDVGLTYRNEVGQWHMPINEGVILASSGSAPALRKFFDATLSLYETLAAAPVTRERYGFDVRKWRGGQLSLAKLIDWSCPPLAPELREIAGVRVKFLPCTEYNYPVRKGMAPEVHARKWALHYKGDVKVTS